MKRISKLIFLALISFALVGCGTSIMNATKSQQSSEKALVIIDVPTTTSLIDVKKALKEAIAHRSQSFQEKTNFLPSDLPEKPAEPNFNGKTIFGRGLMAMAAGNPQFEMMRTDVTNSYYNLSGTEEFGSVFAKKMMAYIGALYPAKSINRVYLVVYFQEGTSGITGNIAKAVADSIVGAKGAIPFMLQVKEKFLEYIPEGKIVGVQPIELNDVVLTKFNTVTTKEN